MKIVFNIPDNLMGNINKDVEINIKQTNDENSKLSFEFIEEPNEDVQNTIKHLKKWIELIEKTNQPDLDVKAPELEHATGGFELFDIDIIDKILKEGGFEPIDTGENTSEYEVEYKIECTKPNEDVCKLFFDVLSEEKENSINFEEPKLEELTSLCVDIPNSKKEHDKRFEEES